MIKKSLFRIPVIEDGVVWDGEKEEIVICVKNKGLFNRVLQLVLKKPKSSYIHLDKTGSDVWRMINGHTTMLEIAEKMTGLDAESKKNDLKSTLCFLKALNERKLIRFITWKNIT